MNSNQSLTFKIATEPWEFEQIHRLNYLTFVEEIPQHHPNPEQRLVDRFHAENTYLICLCGQELVGPPQAQFQPMFLTLETFEETVKPILQDAAASTKVARPCVFTPGPVTIRAEIQQALNKPPVSHRSEHFQAFLALTKSLLCQL